MDMDIEKSPLFPILSRIEQAPYDAVPERADELREIVKQCGITFAFKPEKEDFHVVMNTKRQMQFGLAVLERLWAYAYAYVHLLLVVQKQEGGVDYDLSANPLSRDAMLLLSWAHDCDRESKHAPWPEDMPHPDPAAPEGSEQRKVTDVFFSMIAWLMLHEIGHCVLGHMDPPLSDNRETCHREEYEADDWASKWHLHDWKEESAANDKGFLYRALGPTIVLSIFTSWEVHERLGASDTHPDAPDRLLRFLDKFIPEVIGPKGPKREITWKMAGTILQLHLTKQQRALLAPYDTFRGFYIDVMKVLGTVEYM